MADVFQGYEPNAGGSGGSGPESWEVPTGPNESEDDPDLNFLDGLEKEILLPDTRITDIGAETDGALPAVIIEAITDLIITAVERASRRIDLKALAEKNKIPVPNVNIGALLKK